MKQRERVEDQEEALRVLLDGFRSLIWTAMPAVVNSFDATKQTCEVTVAIQGTQIDKEGKVTFVDMDKCPCVDVPVYRLRGGGFSATVPLVKDDEGILIFASRCIDNWWQNGGFQNQPFEQRMHDLSDGFFLPGFNSQPKKLSNFATDAFEIRNDAGDVKFDLKVDQIILTAKNSIVTLKQDEIDIVATAVKITGDLTVTGKLTTTDTTSLGGGAQALKRADGTNTTKVTGT